MKSNIKIIKYNRVRKVQIRNGREMVKKKRKKERALLLPNYLSVSVDPFYIDFCFHECLTSIDWHTVCKYLLSVKFLLNS